MKRKIVAFYLSIVKRSLKKKLKNSILSNSQYTHFHYLFLFRILFLFTFFVFFFFWLFWCKAFSWSISQILSTRYYYYVKWITYLIFLFFFSEYMHAIAWMKCVKPMRLHWSICVYIVYIPLCMYHIPLSFV